MGSGILSAARLPNRWSVTHYLFNYEHGWIKRGLFGELVRLAFPAPYSYSFLAGIAWIVFAALLVALVLYVWPVARQNSNALVLVAAFFASAAFVYLTHIVGYLDHVGLLLVVLCLFLPVSPAGLAGRTVLCIVGINVHEAFLVCFLPLVVGQYVIAAGAPHWRRLFMALLCIGLPTLAVGIALAESTVGFPVQQSVAWLQSEAANFSVRPDAVEVLARDITTNTAMTAEVRSSSAYQHELTVSLWATLPLLGFFALSSLSMLRRRHGAAFLVPAALCLAASCSPWIMHVVAWDVVRFNAMALTTAFLFWVSVRREHQPAQTNSNRWPLIAALVFVVGSPSVPMFDGYQQDRAPYTQTVELWTGIASAGVDASVPDQ